MHSYLHCRPVFLTQGRWVWLDGIGLGKGVGVGVLLHWGGGVQELGSDAIRLCFEIVFTVIVILTRQCLQTDLTQ